MAARGPSGDSRAILPAGGREGADDDLPDTFALRDAGLVADVLEQALEGCRLFVSKVVAASVEADSSWGRVQAGVGLLRLCALPRLLHLFRALPPAATMGLAEKADAATLEAYEKL